MIELIREYWDWFVFDTLVWTGALIGLALVLRRPVARLLGAGASYALWLLPMARLLFPPVILPAWMKPAAQFAEPAVATDLKAAPVFDASMPGLAAPVPMESPLDLTTPLIAIWLVGAVVFLVRRFWLYGRLRAELLADARPVGEVGEIRLIETPVISGPMAFGILDKVIALPAGFMVSRDRGVRDLAIAHELAHHRGHDLLANVLVQPLFALHWFNPLGWMGWTAMRRDQEAACDARVVACRSREERAAYASVIADFARQPGAAPRPALAAPMACPVLGDKSIIHRLRSLPMTDSSRRRRFAARGTLVAALLALPATASIGYAEASAARSMTQAPIAPQAPEAPQVPAAPQAPSAVDIERDAIIIDRDLAGSEQDMAEARREIVRVEREIDDEGKERITRRVIRRSPHGMSHEESAEFEREMAELDREMAQLREELGENGKMQREIRIAVAEAQAGARAAARARANAPTVVMQCKDQDSPVTSETDSQGHTTLFVCESFGDRVALKAMRSARAAIVRDRNLSEAERAEALRELDEEIANHSR